MKPIPMHSDVGSGEGMEVLDGAITGLILARDLADYEAEHHYFPFAVVVVERSDAN